MSELNGPNFGVNQVNFKQIQKTNVEAMAELLPDSEEKNKQITDFSNSKAEALGRSMLFKGVDDVNHDLKVLLENPDIAKNSDEIFETTFKAAQAAGMENPYEEAASASTVAI